MNQKTANDEVVKAIEFCTRVMCGLPLRGREAICKAVCIPPDRFLFEVQKNGLPAIKEGTHKQSQWVALPADLGKWCEVRYKKAPAKARAFNRGKNTFVD